MYTLDTTGMPAGVYEYRLVVANPSGIVTNTPATMDLLAASGPVLVTDSAITPALAFVGASPVLSASFSGTKPISYQWYYTNNGSTTPLTGATNTTFTLSGVPTNRTGGYFLLASNDTASLGAQTAASSVA